MDRTLVLYDPSVRRGLERDEVGFVVGIRIHKRKTKCNLTERELDIIQWAANGKSNKDIGELYDQNVDWVKRHLNSLYKKVGIADRAGAVAHAIRAGWIV